MLTPPSLAAQIADQFLDYKKYKGTAVVPFLAFPTGARGAAFGHASVVLLQDASSAFWNPATLGLLRKHEFSFSHNEMFLGVRNECLAVALPRDYLGTLALHGRMFTGGTFKNSRDIDERTADPNALDLALGASYGGAFVAERFYAGLGAHYLRSRLEEEQANGVAADCFLYALPGYGFSVTAGARNLGPGLRYGEILENIPMTLAAGLGQEIGKKKQLRWGVGASHSLGGAPEASFGAEYVLAGKMSFRSGYTLALDTFVLSGVKGLALGVGFQEKNYCMDYTWAGQAPELGSAHYLTVRAVFKELKPKTGDDYYEIAEKHFKKGKYERAIEEAQNALMVNPNLWKAHALIAQAYSVMRKTSGLEIALIYTGNTGGMIAPERQGQVVMGGLARRATTVRTLAAQNPYHLIVDAGNLFAPKEEEIKVRGMLKAMACMKYGYLGFGKNELSTGLDKTGNAAEANHLHYVATNLKGMEAFPGFVGEAMIDLQGKYKIYLLNLIGDQYQTSVADSSVSILQTLAVLRKKLQEKGSEADLRVVMANDDDAGVKYMAEMFPTIDILLCGMSNRVNVRPQVLGKTLVLSAGQKGRYAGILNLQFNDRKQVVSYQHRLIPLLAEIPEDAEVADILKEMLIKVEMEKTGDGKDLARGGTYGKFLFVSDRGKSRQIYLKFMQSNMEFRLTDGSKEHLRPLLCPANGKVAYIEETKDTLGHVFADLWTMELAGAKYRPITQKEQVRSFAWHPAGKFLYFCSDSAGNFEIYRTGSEGEMRTNLSLCPRSNEKEIAFSPSGKEMAFITDRDGKDQIYLTGEEGAAPLRLTEENANYALPVFSHDAKYLAYLCDKFGFGGQKDLVTQNLETGNVKFLTQNANVRSFVWTNDNSRIIFESGPNLTDLNVVRLSDDYMSKLLPSETFKNYSEQSPAKLWIGEEERILFQVADEKKTVIHCVKTDGTEEQATVAETQNNWLR